METLTKLQPWTLKEWEALAKHATTGEIPKYHLKDLLGDTKRCDEMTAEHGNLFLDYSRQLATVETKKMLLQLVESSKVREKITAMFQGGMLNTTEQRPVLHTALRAPKSIQTEPGKQNLFKVNGESVLNDVHGVLDRIHTLSEKIRTGELKGATGKKLTNVICIGIGGSYLGPEFVYEALRTSPAPMKASEGRTLRFLANVDPVDVTRATTGLDPESTLVVIVSKTFTTAETMLNARTVREWLVKGLNEAGCSDADEIVSKHMVAVTTAVNLAGEFGISAENVFGFWDWVGGRYSVCSAVGVLPLSLHFGFDTVRKFLDGAHNMDMHCLEAPSEKNLPVLMGMFGVWNSTFLGYETRAVLPYSQALTRFSAHCQQLEMESNGKRVALDGTVLPVKAGEIVWGEPMTNGQHSFMQLIHQGRVVPCEFIGSCKSQQPVDMTSNKREPVSNHDELMSNFFAQPDALACGKTLDDLKAEGVPEELWAHKEFPGNRPSMSLLFQEIDAFALGQLLALYEHRVAVQGFLWGINSFDQWGVELGKVLAKQVRSQLQGYRKEGHAVQGLNHSTTALVNRFLQSNQ